MPDVPLLAALIAGMLSFLSPCVLPLVPPYLVYLTGTSLERFADREAAPAVRRETIGAALLFVLGFTVVFVALGAGASVVGSVLRAYSGDLAMVAGVAIIIMGLHFLGLAPIGVLMRQKRIEVARPVGLWGAYVMGLAFAFGWTPCIGPILAAILAVAASEATVAKGAGMLAVYSLGLGIPFIVAAFAVGTVRGFSDALSQLSRHGREGHGRPAGAHRHRLPHRLHQPGELLAARYVPGAGQDRLAHRLWRRGASRRRTKNVFERGDQPSSVTGSSIPLVNMPIVMGDSGGRTPGSSITRLDGSSRLGTAR